MIKLGKKDRRNKGYYQHGYKVVQDTGINRYLANFWIPYNIDEHIRITSSIFKLRLDDMDKLIKLIRKDARNERSKKSNKECYRNSK